MALSLAASSVTSTADTPLKIGDYVPTVAGLSPNQPLPKDQTPEQLPAALLQIARARLAQSEAEPTWFKKLIRTKVGSYFGRRDAPVPADARAKLLADVIKVFNEFESKDTSHEFDTFVTDKLAPFIAALDVAQIDNPIRHGVATEPISKWTLQTLVVKKMVDHLGKYTNFSKRALDLMVGSHLKGATFSASTIVAWTVIYHYFPSATWSTTMAGVGLATFLTAGPINAVTTAAGGFFVKPTTELVVTLGARLTSNLEANINRKYDTFVAKYFATGNTESNDSVRIATFEDEHTDFAGMLPEDQLKNWAHGLNLFIMVQAVFGRLLRGTHHGGRDLMMLSWTDSQNITQLVELLDTKEHVLQGLELAVLAPYRNAFITHGDMAKKNDFDAKAKTFNQVIEDVWMNPDASQAEVDVMAQKIESAANALRAFGLNDGELRNLLNINRKRGQAVGKLITAAAVGHLRQFYGAERNRNLAKDAHSIALAIQVGFGTEEYTERYLPLVRRQMKKMGMQFSDESKASALVDPQTIAREQCLLKNLRRELAVPSGANAETYACINALVGFDAHRDLRNDPNSATAQVMNQFRSQGNRLEAGGVIKYAATMLNDSAKLQQKVGAALARCQ